MNKDNQTNNFHAGAWAWNQEMERHRENWFQHEWAYPKACWQTMEDLGYDREVWELAPFITYMLLSRRNLDSTELREEIEGWVEETIAALKADLPHVLGEADRLIKEYNQETIDLLAAQKAKSLNRSEARKRRMEASASQR